ncbi:S-layer homology domain-containing protein [Cohnella sp. JJ-181]|uniref:S-layer homology domain-containing protein n=1 Tax=Cohnella rhizoplanae TaxID=2974897 RepID=UPI0022FF4F9A|nr:S-layer homology domain-containing protein [Cohnella sp. JJ-181]CAI6083775.1 hypothetical protein COHCIP112018_04117 [Cohnella sp. JJ-181]
MKRNNERHQGKKNKKQKAAKAYLQLLNASLLAASLTAGVAGHAAKANAESPVAPSASVVQAAASQLPVYEGDSLMHFRNMLGAAQQNDSLIGGEGIPHEAVTSLTVAKNTAIVARLSSVDKQVDEADDVFYKIVKGPSKGVLELLDNATGTFRFTPPADLTEKEITFTFVEMYGEDQSKQTEEIEVTLHITETADQKAVAAARDALVIGYASGDTAMYVTQNLTLPAAGTGGTTVTWTSSAIGTVSDTGAVTRPVGADAGVQLTAAVRLGEATAIRVFDIVVKALPQTSYTPPSSSSSGEQLISAVRSSDQTPNSASLQVAKGADGKARSATIRLLAEGVKTAAGKAQPGDKVSIVTPDLTGVDQVLAVLPGDAMAALADKQAVLAIETGAAGARVPAEAFDIAGLAERAGVTADRIELRLAMTKEAAASVPAGALAGGAALSAPYSVKLTAGLPDGRQVDVPFYDARFATLTIPLDRPVTEYANAMGVIIEDGKAYPVPVRFTADGKAEIHTTRNGTFMLIERSASGFNDTAGHWASSAITTLANKRIVEGAEGTDGAYAPDASVTRAEFAVMLVRALGLDTPSASSGAGAFADVSGGAAYAQAVSSAISAGLFKGISSDRFAPDQPITREQMAAVLVRAAKAYHLSLPQSDSPTGASGIERFSDGASVSAWARDEVDAAVRAGLVQGGGDGRIASGESGTRSQTAAMLLQLLQRAGLIN